MALAAFGVFSLYRELLRPPLYALVMALLRKRAAQAALLPKT